MKAAEQLRGGSDAGYGPAVDRLEQALADAERAAGRPLHSRAPAGRAAPVERRESP